MEAFTDTLPMLCMGFNSNYVPKLIDKYSFSQEK